MAGNELKAVITVDAANATFTIEKFVQSTTGGMGQAATASKGAASAFSGLGGAALAINQAFELTQRVVGAVVGVLRDVIGAGSEFEKQIGAVSTLLIGDASTSIEKIQSDLLGLDDRLGSSADLTAALYQALSAGVEAGKGVAFVGEAAKLASAGLGDLSGTVDLLTTVLNAYGLEAEDSKAVSEVLFEAVKKGKTTIEELSGSMGRVIPTAKNLGVGIGDLSAVIAKLTTVGLSTDIAVTSLNAALVAIQSPGADAEKVAKALGISFDDLRKTIREQGLVAGLQQLQEATGGNTQVIAKLIPSIEAQRAAFALLGTDMDELNGYMADFNAEAASGTQVAEAFDARAKTLDGSINALGVSAEKAKVSLLEGIRDPLISIIEKSRENVDAISDWMRANRDVINSGFDTWISGLKIVMDDLAPAVRAVADAMQWWRGSLDSTVGGINQQIRDTEAAMQDLISSNKFWWFESEATTKASKEYKNLETQLAGLQETLKQAQRAASSFGKSVDEGAGSVATAGAVAVDTGSQFDAMVATWKAGKVDLSKLGDEAEKTAKKLAESANRVAQLAGQSVQFAQSQLQQAAATGDLTRTTDAYVVAMDKAGAAYQAEIEASNAAAAAGASAAEVDGMRKEALEKLASAANQAATTQASAYQREEAAQSSLAHYLGQTTIAHDMEALAMANASEVAEAYSQTVVDIAAELKRTTDEIERKRGVTLTSAEADKALAEANERAGQQISAAGKAAVQASSQVSEFGRAVQSASDQAANAFGDLAARIITGSVSFKDAGKAAAQIFMRAFEDVLSSTLGSVFKAGFDAAGGVIDSLIGDFAGSLGSAMGVDVAKEGTKGLVKGISSAVLEAALANPVTASIAVATAGLGIAFAVGWEQFFDKPDMQSRISKAISKMLAKSMQDVRVTGPIDAALEALGFDLSAGLAAAIVNAPLSGAEIRAVYAESGATAGQSFSDGFYAFIGSENNKAANQIAASDLVNLYFPGLDEASEAAATEMAKAAGAAAAAAQGLVGDDALVFAEQFGAGLTNLAHQMNLTDEEFLAFLEDVAGPGAAGFAAAMDQMNAAGMKAFGPGWQAELDSVADGMERVFGLTKNINSGNLFDVFIKSGQSAEVFAAQLERMAASDPQLRALIDSLDPPLVDALHAVEDGASGAAAAFRDLVGTVAADLTNVVDAANILIGNVSFEGLTDQLASLKDQLAHTDDSELAAKLEHDIAAVEAQLDALSPKVDVINSQIQDSLRSLVSAAEQDGTLAVDEFTAMLQELQILATLPAGTVSDSTQALIDQIIAQFQVALKLTDEQVADLRAQIEAGGPIVPPEVVTPPVDQDALNAAAAATDGITTSATDATTATDGLTTSTTDAAAATGLLADEIDRLITQGATLSAAGASVTEALGLTPEAAAAVTNITAGLSTAASGATDMAAAVQQVTESVSGSTDEFSALSQAAGLSSDQVQAALAMVVGTVDDGKSLEAVAFKLDSITQFLPAEMVPSFQESFDSANASVSSTFAKVGELQSALTTLASGNYDIHQTITTEYVTVGEPPPDTADDTGHAAGHWTVPGPQGAPYRTTVHGGEEVLSVEQSRDYRRTMRERALDGLEARAGSTVLVPVPEARAPAPGDVAGEVVDRLTQGGRLHLFVVPEVDAQKLADAMVLTGIDRASRSGALMGVQLRRNPARPS